ncbi:MAG: PTS sugar transporter subunit IIC, partial [Ruminococcaceae bacterium]|nr:PTS sugar transporter subunit IIC [Oscillospiraceae bacterium]
MAKGKYSYAKKRKAAREERDQLKKSELKKKLKSLPKRYFIDAMGAMALGLFASLLIGTIFDTLGNYIPWDPLKLIATYAKSATGMAIGVAIAYKLGAHPLVIFSCAGVGALGNALGAVILDNSLIAWAVTGKGDVADSIFYSAGPAGAFFAVILAAEIGMLVSKKTPVDILVTPVVTLLAGFAGAWLFCPLVSYLMYFLGIFIASTTTLYPLFMGIIVSVVVGIILTLPISSAAICAMIFSPAAIEVATANGTLKGLLLAGGAATVGCCAQMVGFAVSSFRENKWGGLVSQGLGTSMLQMGNICRRPQIW